MNAFEEDENPFAFQTSKSTAALPSPASAPSSPPPQITAALSGPATIPRPQPVSTGPPKPTHTTPKTEYCCNRDRWLHGDDNEILIHDAQKSSLGSSSVYIVYIIKSGDKYAQHRYSEFESLRTSLVKLHPTIIIPPIPSKNTIGDYAIKQSKVKEDAALIARRKRMLQTFLNRIAKHPILSNDHVFHRFLEGDVSWSEVLHSPPLSLLPKNILKAPSHDPTDPDASAAYAALPNPSATSSLRNPDQRFLDSEAFTQKFSSHVGGPMEKVTRRVLKRWADDAQDHGDLGAALNGFSLSENGSLAAAIEKTGQAVDATYISTSKLLQELEQTWEEPLHEYAQFAGIIKKALVYRHQKHLQCELTQSNLESQRYKMEDLEKSEKEAQRLQEALGKGRASRIRPVRDIQDGMTDAQEEEEEPPIPAVNLPPHPGPSPIRTRSPGMGLLNALSYTISGIMDADPEAARRNNITKTRESIAQLEAALKLSVEDLKYTNSTIQADLDRFQRQKVADLREMAISMARSHRDWCKKNMDAWEEAKKEIATISDHPNALPPPAPEANASPDGGKPLAAK